LGLYNNTLNQLTKADKSNTTEYYVYDYQGNRVRSVVESNNQVQSQRDYLPLLDISTNQAKQQNHTADSIALVIIDRVLCGVAFVCFGKLVKSVVIVPM
jgi:hypothetical protein